MLTKVWPTLRKRPWWMIAGLLVGLLTGIVQVRREPAMYRATARIQISGSGVNKLRLNSHAVLNQLISDLDLLGTSSATQSSSSRRDTLLRQLRSSISIRIVPDTRIITISFTGLEPRFAAQLVNKLVADYTDNMYRTHFDAVLKASQWPANQLETLKAEVQATQVEMIQVQRRLGNTGFASEYSREDRTLDALTRSAVEARSARDEARVQYDRVAALDPAARARALDALPSDGAAPELSLDQDPTALQARSTRLQMSDAQAMLAALAAIEGPNNPERKAQQAQVDSLDRQLGQTRTRRLADLRSRLQLARQAASSTDATLTAALATAYGEGGDTLQYRKLLREFTFTRALYVRLYGKVRNATISAGLGTLQVEVIDAAQVPASPVPQMGWLLILGTTAGGFLLGAILALALENLRPGLRSVNEVEAVTDLPSLATLPHLTLSSGVQFASMSTAQRNLMAIEQPSSHFTEGLRILRLNLDLSGSTGEPRFILFTSSTPSEGKTTIAGNYAVVLAERGGRVLLIDADMHRPNLHHRFGLSGRRGLSTALSGQCRWQDVVQTIAEVPNLDVLVAGPVPPAPAALLAGPALLRLLRQAGPVYTHVVLDSPPVMAVNDGIMLSQLVDAVVFVVRHGKIDKRIVRLGRERLSRSGAPMAGTVLNGLALIDDTRG